MKIIRTICPIIIFFAMAVGLLQISRAAVSKSSEGVAYYNRDGWVYYLPAAGKQPRKLVQGIYQAMSPDGKTIAYCKMSKQNGSADTLLLFNIAANKSKLILSTKETISDPCWSPKGDYLAFVMSPDVEKETLYIIKADGTGKQKVVTAGESGAQGFFSPEWSADGKSIVFHDLVTLFKFGISGNLISKTPLAVITGKQSAVTSTDRFVPCPTDGKIMAFSRSVQGTPLFEKACYGEPNTAIYIFSTQTGQRIRLTADDLLAFSPCWSRDGRYIYFTGYRDKNCSEAYPFRLYRMGRDGKGLIQIGRGEDPSQ